MKGLELSRGYFNSYGKLLIEAFPQCRNIIAVGLVGEGSECFGFDDEISRDHDFEAGFCIWIPRREFQKWGEIIRKSYDVLPDTYNGLKKSPASQINGRRGLAIIEDFYFKYTAKGNGPVDNIEWMRIPEEFLATVSNGEVFFDELGEFSAVRNRILQYYPEDVFRKRLAAELGLMGQSGQYNLFRMLKRGDEFAVALACNEFINSTISVIYLLNRKFKPFYKWAFKGMENLYIGESILNDLKSLISNEDRSVRKYDLVEKICNDVEYILNMQGLTVTTSSFILDHGKEIMSGISDFRLRNMNIFQKKI